MATRKPLDTVRLAALAAQINTKQAELDAAKAAVTLANANLDRLLTDLEVLRGEVHKSVSEYLK
jgi:hypothetical protein